MHGVGNVACTWRRKLGYQQDSIWYILCSRNSVDQILSLNFLWVIAMHNCEARYHPLLVSTLYTTDDMSLRRTGLFSGCS